MQSVAFKILLMAIGLVLLAGCERHPTPENVIRLRFWHAWGGYEGQILQGLVDEYNQANPDVIVEASQFTIGDKLLASIAGGKPPDIATVWSYMLTPMGESGAFLSLNDYMTSSGFTRGDFLPNVWDYGLYGDNRWGVPTTLNVTAIFYIRDTLKEAGLNPDVPPRSTAELERWAAALLEKDNSGNITRLGFVPTQTDVWLRAFGGELFDEDAHRFTLTDPLNIEGLKWMEKMINQSGGMATYRRFTAQYGKLDSPSNPLFTGKLAMKEDGQWVIQFFKKFAPQIDYGMFPYPPAVAGGPEVAKLDGSFWAIPVGTEHPDEAWKFLSWLISPEQSARLCAGWLNLPPMRETLERPEFAALRRDEKFDFFVKLLEEEKALPQPTTPVSEQLFDKLEAEAQRVFSGSIAAEAMFKELNADLNAELERTESLMGIEP